MRITTALITGVVLLLGAQISTASFTAFESGQVRPLAMSPDGKINIQDLVLLQTLLLQ